MSLMDEGLLELDDQIGTWIPGIDPLYEEVTVRMLLNHTSGFFQYTEDPEIDVDPHRVSTPQELLDLTFSHEPYCTPGAEYHYSNANYIALGMILEAVADQPVATVLGERAISVPGLEHTLFAPSEEVVGDVATPFTFDGDEIDVLWDLSVIWTAGGMMGVAADTANWIWELYAARSVIRSDLVDQMIDDAVVTDLFPLDTSARYGFGTCIVTLADTNCGVGVGHNGRWQWSSTDAFYFEDCNTSVAVLQNALLHPPSLGVELVLTKVLGALFP